MGGLIMKCQNCGSENVSPDLAVTHQVLVKKDGTHVNILADLCKDCGTIRWYVKDKDKEYTSREEASQKEKKYFDEMKVKSAKQKRISRILTIIGLLLMLLSLFCQYNLSLPILTYILLFIGTGLVFVCNIFLEN